MHDLTTSLPLYTAIPFVLMLLCIAIAPLVVEKWWEHNVNKLLVVLALSIPTIVYLFANGLQANLEHQLFGDYLPFIVLLTTLFVITGNLRLQGDIPAKPWVNTLFLFIGYTLASFMGTTGAAMLLIRPILAINAQRKYRTHTVLFFIAAVANCGGLLTPLGDPPLLLFYLRGVPFGWFLQLFPEWLVTGALLLLVYFVVDSYFYKREAWQNLSADQREKTPIRLRGTHNLLYLLGAILAVAFVNGDYFPRMTAPDAPFAIRYARELLLVALTLLSFFTTKRQIRVENHFSWTPILEVAILFLGIFVTMTPALMLLSTHAAQFGLSEARQFYYATGALSAFLDNAPTAVAFFSIAEQLPLVGNAVAGVSELLVRAISVGAVYFGAMTYIGNGPNFMVKAIAEESGVPMPSFFGYMAKFSLVVLLPIYVVVQLLFF